MQNVGIILLKLQKLFLGNDQKVRGRENIRLKVGIKLFEH